VRRSNPQPPPHPWAASLKRSWIALACLGLACGAAARPPRPPAQPTLGPGGSQAPHAATVRRSYGEGELQVWIFEPAAPSPAAAPVVVFLHGWGALVPTPYLAWIEHLARRGNVVVYPRYQESLSTPLASLTPNAESAVRAALRRLRRDPGHVRPAPDLFALAGHSAGGLLAANLAARAPANGLPPPRAVMSVEPGRSWGPPWRTIPLADLSRIPAGTLLLAVAGEDDRAARDVDARRIVREATAVAAADKNLVTLVSDRHGSPPLLADHLAPTALAGPGSGGRRAADALDYFGIWKLLDGLLDAAFFGRNREYALGDTPQQRFMGRWSDGVPVKPLRITATP
jgi:acetyl esterase/lipase